MTEYLLVTTTVDSREAADQIAEQLVRKRLAACAQVGGPVSSTYWWQQKVESAQEWLCLLKTARRCYDKLESELRELHPYDVPQIIAVPIAEGSQAYLHWLHEELSQE